VTTGEASGLARANLVTTYLALGSAVPGARLVAAGGFTLCTAPVELAMANFAMDFAETLSPVQLDGALRQIVHAARTHSALRVFDLPGPKPDGFLTALARAGLTLRHEMVQMCALEPAAGPVAKWTECGSRPEREAIARFMAGQFFPTLDAKRRKVVIEATAQLGRLFYSGRPEVPVAACTLVETEGAAGIYNLCVAPEHRRRGVGGAFVRASRQWAAETGRRTVLQCDPCLTGFYATLGFVANGWIGTYGFGQGR
jgi:GNAT superfamily N-acetyltransferase